VTRAIDSLPLLIAVALAIVQPAGAEQQAAPAEGSTTAQTSPDAAGEAAPEALNPERFGEKKRLDPAYGAFQRGLYVTAYNLALPRARNGDPAAQALVAEILARGLGVPRDAVEAAKWYALASEQGIPEAQFQYALMLLDGAYVKKDVNGAYALLEAAAEAGNILAQFNFAQLIVDREPGDAGMAKAVSYYERAAAGGLADAQYAMSQIFANGAGGRKRDDVEARRWLELAARQGFDTAELDLGTWMVEGRGGPRDRKAGFNWLRRAALAGNVAAQNRVAKLYMKGLGTDPDELMAAAWYIVARRAGLADPEMDDMLNGLTPEETKKAIEKANRLR
jgi:TPR repeat protein